MGLSFASGLFWDSSSLGLALVPLASSGARFSLLVPVYLGALLPFWLLAGLLDAFHVIRISSSYCPWFSCLYVSVPLLVPSCPQLGTAPFGRLPSAPLCACSDCCPGSLLVYFDGLCVAALQQPPFRAASSWHSCGLMEVRLCPLVPLGPNDSGLPNAPRCMQPLEIHVPAPLLRSFHNRSRQAASRPFLGPLCSKEPA